MDNRIEGLRREPRGNPVGMENARTGDAGRTADRRWRGAEGMWQEAAAIVEAELADDAMAEAFEVYRAEIARSRLIDHTGSVQVTLVGGAVVRGLLLGESPVADCLYVHGIDGPHWLIPVAEVLMLRGGVPRLRPEVEGEQRRLTSWLRDHEAEVIWVRMRDATHRRGVLDAVASDHVILTLAGEDAQVRVPVRAVEAWGVTEA